MHTSTYLSVAVVAYLLGSIPFGYILVRLFTGADVRAQGSGNIGATNVARTGKKGLAIATLALDAIKGVVAVVVAKMIAGNSTQSAIHLMALAAFLAVVGHMFPIWLKFKGGKGVATGLGVFLALAPFAVLIVLGIFVAIVAITRYVSLGSIVAAALFPFVFWALRHEQVSPTVLALTMGVAFLIVVKHKANIGRLLSGNENKFGSKKK